MMNEKAQAYKELENELYILTHKAHKSGLGYWEIMRIFMLKSNELYVQAEAEYFLKGGK